MTMGVIEILVVFLLLFWGVGFFLKKPAGAAVSFAKWSVTAVCGTVLFFSVVAMLLYGKVQQRPVPAIVDNIAHSEPAGLTSYSSNGVPLGPVSMSAPLSRTIVSEHPSAWDEVIAQQQQNETSAWDENIPLVANVYPSAVDCGGPLASRIVQHLSDQRQLAEDDADEPTAEAEERPTRKYIIDVQNGGLTVTDYLNFLIQFRKEIQSNLNGSVVNIVKGDNPKHKTRSAPKKDSDEPQRLLFVITQVADGSPQQASWDKKARLRSGQIIGALHDHAGQTEFAVDFVEKPWVANSDKFVSQHPKKKFIIGFSPRLATTEQEARVGALNDANDRLQQSRSKRFAGNYDKERNVVDRFVQKLTMPYGSVWREAVLIDYGMHDTQFGRIKGNQTAASSVRRLVTGKHFIAPNHAARPGRRGPGPEAMLIGLTTLTIVLAWGSNWLTQGYYRRSISWTTMGAFAGLLFLLFLLILNVA